MAGRSVLYHIRSKDDTRGGINSAMQNLKGFDNRLKSVSSSMKSLLKYGAIAGAAAGVARSIGAVTEAYRVQEASEIQLAQAVRNNPLLNGKSFQALKAYNSQLQSQSKYGDEVLNAEAAKLAAQGRSEEQIKSILAASVDLASAGVMPLESAVKNLAKTYSGMAGELGESIPSLRTLTKEQLANGDAVALVAEQYRGMGKAMASSREGIKQQLSNIIGDIKEKFGEIWTTLTGDFNARFLPIAQKIDTWLSENKERIINFFRYFPDIALTTFNTVKAIIAKVFTPEFWKVFGSIAWDWFKEQARLTFTFLGSVISAIATTLWEPLKWGFNGMVYGVKTIFAGIINFFIDKINWLGEKAHDLGQKIAHPINAAARATYSGGIERINTNFERPGELNTKAITDAWKEVADDYKGVMSDQFALLKDTWAEVTAGASSVFGDELGVFLNQINEKLTAPVITALEKATAITDPATESQESRSGYRIIGDIADWFKDRFTGVMDGIKAGYSSSVSATSGIPILGELVAAIGPIVKSLSDLFSGISSVTAILNPLKVIFDGILSVVAPVMHQLLQPLLGILRILGQTIGAMIVPTLKILAPIIEIIGKAFVWLYNNAIRPVANMFIATGNAIYNGVVWIINGIIGLINKIPGVKVKKLETKSLNEGKLEKIKYEDVSSAGAVAAGSASSSGTGAAYTGGKNITNNWYINIGAFTADQETFQEFVRFITLEQQRLERLGLT